MTGQEPTTRGTEKERAVIDRYLRMCGGSAPPMLLDILRVLAHPDLIDTTRAWLDEASQESPRCEDGVPVVVLACSATCKSALTVRSDPAAQELLERTLLREGD